MSNKAEKLASLERYLQAQKDRLSFKNFKKRDTSQFLAIDIMKTEKQIAALKLEGVK